mgnify:CR=1 FL=1
MKQNKRFNQWWKGIRKKPATERTEILTRWLNYATRTAGLVHSQEVQRVIFTIRDRFVKSKYKKITRSNAETVYHLINIHQQNYRRHTAEREDLRREIARLKGGASGNVIRRRIHKTIHRG